jgi:putative endonuclease
MSRRRNSVPEGVGPRESRRQALGRAGEAYAAAYLEGLGCEIVGRNYRCRGGEIDLVVIDGDALVFVEVKTRRHEDLGSPLEAVDRRKQERMITAALSFLAAAGAAARVMRFDVIGILWRDDAPRLDHIRDAFQRS